MAQRPVGLRPMRISPEAAAEIRRLLADPTVPRHNGYPVPVADARLLRQGSKP